MELFLKNGELITESEWREIIGTIRAEVEVKIREDMGKGISYEQLKEELKQNLFEAIQIRIPNEPFGIFFSGGVDSSTIAFICSLLLKEFTCYTAGFRDGNMDEAPDFVEAKTSAEILELPLISKQYDLREAETIVSKVITLLPRPHKIDADYVVKVGVASVVLAAQCIAGEKVFFSGLGSEEIFAGYQRHERAENINEECWQGLLQMWSRDLVRDCTIAAKLGIQIRTPFLDKNLIVTAMRIDGAHKIKGGHKKAILREIVEELGLPKKIAWRKKMGAQYGSRFDAALEKLAKKYNCKYKKEYLATALTQSPAAPGM